MPLYEYECDACGQRFELIRKFSESELDVCTLCGKGPVRRLMSSPAIQFKGTGWYITDYSSKGKAGTEAPSTAKSDSTKTDSTKSDSGSTGTAAKTESGASATAKSSSEV
jgi:putative FmdB family regulatory protein